MAWAYQWSNEETYYTPLDEGTLQGAVKRIEKYQHRLFNGHIWLVDEKSKFKPPGSWIIVCFAVLHREDEERARFHPCVYNKTLYFDEKREDIGEVT